MSEPVTLPSLIDLADNDNIRINPELTTLLGVEDVRDDDGRALGERHMWRVVLDSDLPAQQQVTVEFANSIVNGSSTPDPVDVLHGVLLNCSAMEQNDLDEFSYWEEFGKYPIISREHYEQLNEEWTELKRVHTQVTKMLGDRYETYLEAASEFEGS